MLSNFGRKFAPDSIQSGEWDGWGRVSDQYWGTSHGTRVSTREQTKIPR